MPKNKKVGKIIKIIAPKLNLLRITNKKIKAYKN